MHCKRLIINIVDLIIVIFVIMYNFSETYSQQCDPIAFRLHNENDSPRKIEPSPCPEGTYCKAIGQPQDKTGTCSPLIPVGDPCTFSSSCLPLSHLPDKKVSCRKRPGAKEGICHCPLRELNNAEMELYKQDRGFYFELDIGQTGCSQIILPNRVCLELVSTRCEQTFGLPISCRVVYPRSPNTERRCLLAYKKAGVRIECFHNTDCVGEMICVKTIEKRTGGICSCKEGTSLKQIGILGTSNILCQKNTAGYRETCEASSTNNLICEAKKNMVCVADKPKDSVTVRPMFPLISRCQCKENHEEIDNFCVKTNNATDSPYGKPCNDRSNFCHSRAPNGERTNFKCRAPGYIAGGPIIKRQCLCNAQSSWDPVTESCQQYLAVLKERCDPNGEFKDDLTPPNRAINYFNRTCDPRLFLKCSLVIWEFKCTCADDALEDIGAGTGGCLPNQETRLYGEECDDAKRKICSSERQRCGKNKRCECTDAGGQVYYDKQSNSCRLVKGHSSQTILSHSKNLLLLSSTLAISPILYFLLNNLGYF